MEDKEIDKLVNEYIYGDRITFTLWSFQNRLRDMDYETIKNVEGNEYHGMIINGFRNLKITKIEEYDDKLELVYVYSKEYLYIYENGKNDSVWEQHRGCI